MTYSPKKIKSFTDLDAWKKAHELVLSIYKITKYFPHEERFGLTNQVRRSAVSVSSNIAEGFSRHTSLEKKHFYYLSLGSLTEVQNQILIARDVKFIPPSDFQEIAGQTIIVSKLLNSLIKYLNLSNT